MVHQMGILIIFGDFKVAKNNQFWPFDTQFLVKLTKIRYQMVVFTIFGD